jgi:hypothetical protein
MTITRAPICLRCKFFHQGDWTKMACDAFPDGIPLEIVQMEFDHHEPYPDDHGIRFQPALEGDSAKVLPG